MTDGENRADSTRSHSGVGKKRPQARYWLRWWWGIVAADLWPLWKKSEEMVGESFE
jgi:hypothetical protein